MNLDKLNGAFELALTSATQAQRAGNLFDCLPMDNVGSTRMGAFEVAALPDDIAELLRD